MYTKAIDLEFGACHARVFGNEGQQLTVGQAVDVVVIGAIASELELVNTACAAIYAEPGLAGGK